MHNRRTWAAPALTALGLDLSGNYVIQGEDGRVQFSIAQHQSERITIIRKSSYLGKVTAEKHTLTLDGIRQKDAPRLGKRGDVATSARSVGAELQIKTITAGALLTMTYHLTGAAIAPVIGKR